MKRVLSIIAALLLTITAAWAQPSGNWTDAGNYASEYKSKVDDEWYLDIHIENAAQLARLAYEINNTENLIKRHLRLFLDDDIDLSSHYWIPISFEPYNAFSSLKLDGQGHTISGMTVNNQVKAGLFGYLRGSSCYVQNLTIKGANISGSTTEYAGFIAGHIRISDVNDCTVEDSKCELTGSSTLYMGGVIGRGEYTVLGRTLNTNKVINTKLIANRQNVIGGGIIGSITSSSDGNGSYLNFYDCHSSVDISCGSNSHVGGIIGKVEADTKLIYLNYCSSSGTITSSGSNSCGGLVGINSGSIEANSCVSAMSITGQSGDIGGLVGRVESGTYTNFLNSFSSAYLYTTNGANIGGLVGSVRAGTCYLTSSTYAGTIFGITQNGGAIVGYMPSDISQTIKNDHTFNGVVYDRSLCNLPAVRNVDGFTEAEITNKKSKELASDEDPYKSLLMAPIDARTAAEDKLRRKMCYEDNIMLAAIPFYVKDPLHSYFCSWQVTTVSELIPVAYNRSTKRALGMYDLVKAPNGAACETFLKLEEDAESAVKTITPLDPGEADVVVTYYNEETKKSLQRKVHLVVTYGIPWNDNEPSDFPGGNGAINDPYLIQNATQLLRVANDKEVYNRSDMYYRLTNDIFLNTNLLQADETAKSGAKVWTPVEWHANLDGSGNSIYGAYITGYINNSRIEKSYTASADPKNYYKIYETAGLFSILSGHVHDMGIVDSYLSIETSVTGSVRSGLLCGLMTGEAKVERCIIHGIVDNRNFCGGVVGNGGEIDLDESIRLNRALSNPVIVKSGIVEDCFACVHVEYGLHKNNTATSTGTGSGIAGSNVKQINRCVFTGKVENFEYRRGIAPTPDTSVSDVSTWYFDKQQMTAEFQTTQATGEHTTAEMIGGDIFAGSSVWQHEKGRYPMLKQFAKTPYGDILSMPVLFGDGDRAGHVTKIFEFPTDNVTWTASHGDTYVDVINECGAASPMSTGADYISVRTNESNSECTKALRVMHLDVVVPYGTIVGIDFKDVNCKKAWLTALGKNVDTGVVTLRDAVTLKSNFQDSDTEIIETFNTKAIENHVTAFPELRFFTGIKVLKRDLLSGLSDLTEVELPRQLTDIGPGVFSGCTSLESVTIPTTTEAIEPGVLDGSSIKDIYVEPRNTCFEVRDHALFTTDADLYLMAYPPARGEQSITLHGPFHNIASHAFYQIPQLDTIYIDYPKPEGSAVQLDDEAIVHYDYGQLMDIYINDGTFDGEQWKAAQYATGGNDDGILMKEYLAKVYWQPYASAGKLHRYFPLTISSAQWGTMYIGFCTKLPSNIKAYIMEDEVTPETREITLKRTPNKLHHTVPVVVYSETPGTYILTPEPGMTSADNVPDSRNKLMGTNIGQKIGNEPTYGTPVNQMGIQNEFSVLALSRNKDGDVGFFGYTGERLPPFKAYVYCNWVSESRPAFSVVIDDTIDEPSAIPETEASLTSHPSHPGWYSLDGRSLNGQPTARGIYIKNGRKVVIQ